MELRHLRYFVAVAEELNFRRAAERLHICPPPLTVQIHGLEREIGTELLSRKGRSLQLTDAGRVFLEHARQLLAHADQSVALARQAACGGIGHVRVGYNTVAEFGVLPKIVAAFKSRWPNVQFTFRSLRTPDQVEVLSRDELDLGFVCPPVPPDAFDIQELTTQPFVAALSAGHRLATAPIVSFAALSDEPLILYSRALDPDSFQQIQQQFARAGAVMNVAYELETSQSMISLVAEGNGCCIVPEYARRLHRDGVVCKSLEPPTIVRTLAVIKKKGSGGLVESVYRFAVDRLRTPHEDEEGPMSAVA